MPTNEPAAFPPRTIGLFEALGFFAPYRQRPCCIEIIQPWTNWSVLIDDAEEELYGGALALARRGFRVFPVWPARVDGDIGTGKIPIPEGWPDKATTDEQQITTWWRDQQRHKDRIVFTPDANIGIACGVGSNLTIVDLDHRPDEQKDGPAVLAGLEVQHGAIPPGPVVCRGTSRHLYFQHVPGLHNINGVLRGVDVKNDRGYVVAPPSIHKTGGRYCWLEGTENLPLPVMPGWLIEALTPKPKERKQRRRADEPITERQGKLGKLVEAIRSAVIVDDVLEKFGLPPAPSACPLHDNADNPTAFVSYSNGGKWHCFTRCEDGQNDGDVIDLIQRLSDCTFLEAIGIAVRIAEPDEEEDDDQGARP